MHKQEYILEKEACKILWYFEIQTDHLTQARRSDLILINKKKIKRNMPSNYFLLFWWATVKIKGEKVDESLYLARELIMRRTIRLKVILIVIGALETVPKNLEIELKQLKIRRRIKSIQTNTLLKSAQILRRDLETWRYLLVTKTPINDQQLTMG